MSGHEGRGPACPEEELLRAYAARGLSDKDAESLEQHYFACDRCWDRLRRVLELRAALAEGPTEHGPAERRLRGGWRVLAAAAVLAIVAVGLWNLLSVRPRVTRGAADDLAPVVSAVEDGIELRWREVAKSDVYVVDLYTEDGELVLSRETREARIVLAGRPVAGEGKTAARFARIRALDELRRPLAVSRLVALPAGAGMATR